MASCRPKPVPTGPPAPKPDRFDSTRSALAALGKETMKTFLRLIVLLSVLGMVFVAPASAVVVTNAKFPVTLSVFVPCANGGGGEFISVSGDLHVLISTTINGNNVTIKTHFQPQGVSGVGLSSGVKYQATGVTQDQFKGSLQNGQLQASFINNFRMIGQGPGNNLLVHENFHVTVNANGTVTAIHDNFSFDCK